MSWYKELHDKAKEKLAAELKAKGHSVVVEARRHKEVIFDVYDSTTGTAYEILTAKIVRSGHEQDEALLAKIFRYLLDARTLKFYIASYDHRELDFFHKMALEHWHYDFNFWGGLREKRYHKGITAARAAQKIISAMKKVAPILEWCRPRRRAAHIKNAEAEKKIVTLTEKLGLPKNFLKGLWRDWRLLWVWKLEKLLPQWEVAMKKKWLRIKPHKRAYTPQKLRKRKMIP
ncbi:MAG: hypothetical protein QXU88_01165 [Candidatus Woesearchaeota archaeon]